MRLSYTNLNTFKQCPKRYQYKYIDNIPEPPSAEQELGIMGHKVLERYYNAMSIREQATINNLIVEECVTNSKMKDTLFDVLDGYSDFAKIEDKNLEVIQTEVPIDLKLGKFTIFGKIDAICGYNGQPAILEHKFKGQWGTDVAEQYRMDEQNKLYALLTGARQVIYNLIRTKPAKTRPKFERIHMIIPEHEIERLKEDLELTNEMIQVARERNLFPRNRGYMCRYCPFIEQCFDVQVVTKEK